MIYIQSESGLIPINSATDITKEKIINALGYTPADNSTFYEDNTGQFVIADEVGNIIARINEDGIATTNVTANSLILNGTDLEVELGEHINNSEVHITSKEKNMWNSKSDFSGNYSDLVDAPSIEEVNEDELLLVDGYGNIIARINNEGISTPAIQANSIKVKGEDIVNKMSVLEAENQALREELIQMQTSIASLMTITLEEK